MTLDEIQKSAVRHRRGACLVIAGPGSGKTTVLTERVRYLKEELRIPQEKILVITFTRSAAAEMEQRFTGKYGASRVNFGTFHSVFFGILKEHYGYMPADILDSRKQRQILKILLKDAGEVTDEDAVSALLTEIGKIKNGMTDGGASDGQRGYLKGIFTRVCPGPPVREEISGLLQKYEREKEALGKLDYDDLLVKTLSLLKNNAGARKKWQDRYSHILVDEFQDINGPQYEILKILCRPQDELFAVGDDDQSIYSFRGASPSFMLNFEQDFPGASRVVLSRNYRCSQAVTAAASALIRCNSARFDKKIRAVSPSPGTALRLSLKSPEKEASAAALIIGKQLSAGAAPEKIAVLFRTSSASAPLITAFTRNRIPFFLRGPAVNYFRNPVLSPVFACLNWVRGNHTRANFLKFMNCPPRCFRHSDLKTSVIRPEELRCFYLSSGRPWMAEKLDFLFYQLDMLSSLKTPYAMINYIRKAMEYDRFAAEEAREKSQDPKALLEVLDYAEESASGCRDIEAWYRKIAAETIAIESAEKGMEKPPAGKVVLSTIHASKGLEYDTVILTDLNEKILPHEKASTREDLEEERRILYVGMTRAKNALYLLSSEERRGRAQAPSRFLNETGLKPRLL